VELLIIPFVVALLALLIPQKFIRGYAFLGALLSLIVAVVHFVAYIPSAEIQSILPSCSETCRIGSNLHFGYDGLGLVMIVLTNIIVLLILLANYDNQRIAKSRKFTSALFFMQFALLGVFLASNGLLFYIFWELSLIPVFLLFLWFGEKQRRRVLIKFFIYTFVGSLAMLFSLLYIRSMSVSFVLKDLIDVQLTHDTALWVFGGFFLAFAVKIPLFPFHTWQPNTYTKSPMAATMLLGALMLKMALFAMMRWLIPLAPEALPIMTNTILIMATIGVIYAAILAIRQNDMKTIFAYASISHVGLIAAGIIVLSIDALSGAVVQMVNHAFVAVGLFLSAEVIERRIKHRNILKMGGIAQVAPKFAFWFAVIIFAAISVPLTSGFIGEFLLIKGVFNYNWIFGLLVGTTLILACVYSFRAYQRSMFGYANDKKFIDLSWSEWTCFFIITVIVIFLGIYPNTLIHIVEPSLHHLVEIIENTKLN